MAPGCKTNAQARGLCRKHGANGICTQPGTLSSSAISLTSETKLKSTCITRIGRKSTRVSESRDRRLDHEIIYLKKGGICNIERGKVLCVSGKAAKESTPVSIIANEHS